VLRRERLTLISLNPVRSSLEEYYIQKLRTIEGHNESDGEQGQRQREESRKGVGV